MSEAMYLIEYSEVRIFNANLKYRRWAKRLIGFDE